MNEERSYGILHSMEYDIDGTDFRIELSTSKSGDSCSVVLYRAFFGVFIPTLSLEFTTLKDAEDLFDALCHGMETSNAYN